MLPTRARIIGYLAALVAATRCAVPADLPPPPQPSAVFDEDQRRQVPGEKARAGAATKIDKLYGDEIRSARRKEDKAALSLKFLKLAGETTGDPAGHYVLLERSVDYAVQGGDIKTVTEAVGLLEKHYAKDFLEYKYDVFRKLVKNISTEENTWLLLEQTWVMVREAMAKDNYAVARDLLKVSDSAARAIRMPTLSSRAKAIGNTIWAVESEYRKVKDVIKTNPAEPEEKQKLGRYFCFFKGEWEKGLPLLAGGTRSESQLARTELCNPPDSPARLELANGWMRVAEKEKGLAGRMITIHAVMWFHGALSGLAGLEKAEVEKILAEIEKELESEPMLFVSGEVYARADDRMSIRYHGMEIIRSPGNCKRPPPRQVTYWPGDVVCAKMWDAQPPSRSFYFFFKADGDRIQFAHNTQWKTYKPADKHKYWMISPDKNHDQCKKAGSGIWGSGNPAYAYHVIRARDLLPVPGPSQE
jgi:hypothetical protein